MRLEKAVRFRPDFPLAKDDSTKILPWIIGFMVFLAAVSLVVSVNLNLFISGKGFNGGNTVVVQIPASEADQAAAMQAVVQVLQGKPELKEVRPVPESDIRTLLEPWLGKTDSSSPIPIPVMVEAKVQTSGAFNVDELREQVKTVVPAAEVDDNSEWMRKLESFTRSIQLVAAGIVFMIGVVTVCTVILATKTGLKLHSDTIDILNLVGATDSYIAKQFQTNSMLLAMRGGIIGIVMVLPTLFPLNYLSSKLGYMGIPVFQLSFTHVPLILGVLFSACAISYVFSRFATFAILRRR